MPHARLGLVQAMAGAVVPIAIVAVAGFLATQPNIPGWYAGLTKPPYTPPNWLFRPAWTTLYLCLAYALFRILSLPRATEGRAPAIASFFVQLALNGAWSWSFFAARNPTLGLLNIAILLVAIAVTIRLFARLDRIAAALLVPYGLWVSYATYLNLGIWWLNG